jgi:hypothetical protein
MPSGCGTPLRGTLRLVRINILMVQHCSARPEFDELDPPPPGLKPMASFALIGTAKAVP